VEKKLFGPQKTCIAILPWTRTAAILMSKQIQIQLRMSFEILQVHDLNIQVKKVEILN
jgi:hypothetical protein